MALAIASFALALPTVASHSHHGYELHFLSIILFCARRRLWASVRCFNLRRFLLRSAYSFCRWIRTRSECAAFHRRPYSRSRSRFAARNLRLSSRRLAFADGTGVGWISGPSASWMRTSNFGTGIIINLRKSADIVDRLSHCPQRVPGDWDKLAFSHHCTYLLLSHLSHFFDR